MIPINITVPKVGILNFCSGFRWTAVLESVQRNPLTNAITLQSIPLFWRFFCSEFRCKALDSNFKYLKHSDLAVDSTKHCRGFHWTLQWTPPMAALDSTDSRSGIHYRLQWTPLQCFSGIHWNISLNYFIDLFQYQPTKTINHRKKWSSCTSVPESSSFTSSVLIMRNFFRMSKCHKKKDSEFLHLAN